MALIIKSSDIKKSKEKQRQIYTWAACAFVGLFALSVAVPMMSGGDSKSDSKYKDKYYDLAALPFNSDFDEQDLLASSRYQDIGKADLISTLFSKREKEERQLEDEVLGVPPPPDEDYQQAATQREAVANKAERTANKAAGAARQSAPARPTAAGNLKGGNTVSGGGSSGVRTNIWEGTPDSKNKNKNAANANAGKLNDKQTAEDKRKGGRGIGFMDAYAKSVDAGKQEDLLAAASGAASAFDGSKEEAALDTDLENAMGQVGDLNAGMDDARLPSDLGDKLKKAKERAKNEQKEKAGPTCDNMFGNGWGHALSCLGSKLLNGVMDGLSQGITQGIANSIGGGYFGYSKKEWDMMQPWQQQQIINNQQYLNWCYGQPNHRPAGCP